jgi:hypothetical protein
VPIEEARGISNRYCAGFSGVELKAFRSSSRSRRCADALKTVQLMKAAFDVRVRRQYTETKERQGRNVATFDNEKLQKIPGQV